MHLLHVRASAACEGSSQSCSRHQSGLLTDILADIDTCLSHEAVHA